MVVLEKLFNVGVSVGFGVFSIFGVRNRSFFLFGFGSELVL